MPYPRLRRVIAASAVTAIALTGVSACGDDEDAADAPTTLASDQDPTTVPGGAAGGDVAASCDLYTELGGLLSGPPDPAAAGDLLREFAETAPDEIADAVATMTDGYRALLEGDEAALGDPAFAEASATAGDFYLERCDTSAVLDVAGIDYAFAGLPTDVPAGRVGIRFENATENGEPHELVLVKRNEGVTDPVEDLLALPEEEVFSKISFEGVLVAEAAGTTSTGLYDLDAGSYIALCFIPVGGGEDGPPHFTEGMVTEFTVG